MIVLFGGMAGRGKELPDEMKIWFVLGCLAVVAGIFWYFVYYKRE